MLKPYLAKLADGAILTEREAEAAFEAIMSGAATPAQIGAFLMALRVRGERVPEIVGAVRVLRARATPVTAPERAIDIVGTGGDGSGTYNISTAAALVVAGCGVPVAKHGNRAQTSRCGSADVLRALGVNLEAGPERVEAAIREAGFGFLMAPIYHPAMRHVAAARAELGTRTIFNLLGPLINPARIRRQFTGTFSPDWIVPMAEVLDALGCERAWVAHGSDGVDELTLSGPSVVAELKAGQVRVFEISPADAGLPSASTEALTGGDPAMNAAAIRDLLDGKASAFRDAVLLNAAAALLVAERAETLRDGVALAAEAISSGRAQRVLDRVIAITADEQTGVPA